MFIVNQYLDKLSQDKKKDIVYLDSLDMFKHRNPFLIYNSIYIYKVEGTYKKDINLDKINNLFIVCKKCEDADIKINSLSNWQVRDYAYSQLKGMNNNYIDWICNKCEFDINRIDNEISKYKLFDSKYYDQLFVALKNQGQYDDVDQNNIFEFTSAIQNKDYSTLSNLYESIENSDVEPLGVVTTLYNGFKKLLIIATTKNPNEENTGIKNNQIWALKKYLAKYNINQLERIFLFLCKIQTLLITGELPENILREYTIFKILEMGKNIR